MRKKPRISTIRGHSFYADLIDRDSVIVDLGAHKGEFSSIIHREFDCTCHLVEALPALFSQIADGPSVKKYNFAMAGHDAAVALLVSKNLEGNTITPSSVASGDSAITVDGMTLETFIATAKIDTIDLPKIDIEGAEIELLESASDEALSKITQITIEFHDFLPDVINAHQIAELQNRLQRLGFYMIKFSNTLNTDVLFINKHRCEMSRVEYWYLKYIVKYARGVSRTFQKLYRQKDERTQ